MKCRCGAQLGQVNARGEPMLRTRGLVLQADAGLAMVCPRCKADVPFTADLAKALADRIVLFFNRSRDQ